jgi:hypothetical protein
MLIVSVLSAVPMHQRFSLKATLRSDLSDVYQFTFHNQLELVTYFFEQTELNATVCHFADIISLRRRHNSLGPVRAGDESIILIEVSIRKFPFRCSLTVVSVR